MKQIIPALREAKLSLLQLVLFQSFLDTLVVFMFSLLGCLLLTLPIGYAFIPAILYAIMHTRGNLQDASFNEIEKRFPELSEQLITAADNTKEQNEIVDSLHQDVLTKLKNVRTSVFLDFGKITRELGVMAILAFVIIASSAFNVKFLDLAQTVDDISKFKPFQEYDINQELLDYQESQNLSEILGDKTIAELGKEQLDLEINPLLSDVDIGRVKDPTARTFREVPPAEIRASSDSSFEDEIPKQYQRIVKTYFKEITK